MQDQILNRNNKAVGPALSAGKTSPCLHLAQLKEHNKIRIALPAAPRPQLSKIDRVRLKEQRSAELAFWKATGGDSLKTSVAVSLSRLSKAGLN